MPQNGLRKPSYRINDWRFLDSFLQDVSFAFRVLWKNPTFTIVSVVALALGIGGNSTIYSTLNAMVLHPLAFNHLDRIVTVGETLPRQGIDGAGWQGIGLAPANYR